MNSISISDNTPKRARSREKASDIRDNHVQHQATDVSFPVNTDLNHRAVSSSSEDRVLAAAPDQIDQFSVESDPLRSLQFYGSYNSYPDFYQILPENVAYEELDPSLPTQTQSTFLDRAGDLFGNCFSCILPSAVAPSTAQQETTTKDMIDDLLDDVSPPKLRKRDGFPPNEDNEE
jgi:hypothetical protein